MIITICCRRSRPPVFGQGTARSPQGLRRIKQNRPPQSCASWRRIASKKTTFTARRPGTFTTTEKPCVNFSQRKKPPSPGSMNRKTAAKPFQPTPRPLPAFPKPTPRPNSLPPSSKHPQKKAAKPFYTTNRRKRKCRPFMNFCPLSWLSMKRVFPPFIRLTKTL